jgi:hypothetical protein
MPSWVALGIVGDHRLSAAFRAIMERSSGDKDSALAIPPFDWIDSSLMLAGLSFSMLAGYSQQAYAVKRKPMLAGVIDNAYPSKHNNGHEQALT